MKGNANSTMKFANDPLWQKINSFSIDDPAAAFPFSRKLAQENNWDTVFTERAIREYKRFVYLCCTIPGGASPSHIVDEVWHLHLVYTENYWEEFCDKTLGRKLHHHPSRGGPAEKEKHVTWLQDTLQNYKQTFGESPPEDIWKTDPPKKTTTKSRSYTKWLFPTLFFSLALLTGCSNSGYLYFTAIMIIVIFYSIFGPGNSKNESGSGSSGGCSSSGGDSSCGGGCGGCGGD